MKESFFEKMNLKSWLVIFTMIAMAVILSPIGRVNVQAGTITDADYALDLRPDGTVLKYGTSDDITNEIKEKGLYYDSASSKWIMENFSFSTTYSTASCSLGVNCTHVNESNPYTFVIKGNNSIKSADVNSDSYANNDSYAFWCLYGDITFEGEGTLTLEAGQTDGSSRSTGIASQHTLTVNGPTINAKGGKSPDGSSYGISLDINGVFNLIKGTVNTEASDAKNKACGLYYINKYLSENNINITGGTFTAKDNSTANTGTFYGIYTSGSDTTFNHYVNTNILVKNGAKVDITGSNTHDSYALSLNNADGHTNCVTINGTGSEITANCQAVSTCATAFDTVCVVNGNRSEDHKSIALEDGKLTLRDHTWDNQKVVTPATCVKDGSMILECSVDGCGASKTVPILATGKHNYGAWNTTKAPTVLSCGKAARTCSDCGIQDTKCLSKLKATIKLSKTKLTLKKKKSYTVKVTYGKGDSVKSWKSSKKKVATVTSKGKIVAKKKGTAKITVTLKSGKKATVTVKVK